MKTTKEKVLDAVSDATGIERTLITSATRVKPVAHARQLAFLVMRNVYGWTYPKIAMRFERDHTTIVHGVKAAEARIASNSENADEYTAILSRIEDGPNLAAIQLLEEYRAALQEIVEFDEPFSGEIAARVLEGAR